MTIYSINCLGVTENSHLIGWTPSDCWCPGSAKEPLDIEATVMFGKPRDLCVFLILQIHPSVNSDLIEGSLNSKLPTIWRVEKQMKSR